MATKTYTDTAIQLLRLHGVFRRAIEPLGPQVLFDPLEEKLHLPAAFLEVASREARQDQCLFVVQDIAAVEFRCNSDGQPQPAHRG
jgi:hypothetical protein